MADYYTEYSIEVQFPEGFAPIGNMALSLMEAMIDNAQDAKLPTIDVVHQQIEAEEIEADEDQALLLGELWDRVSKATDLDNSGYPESSCFNEDDVLEIWDTEGVSLDMVAYLVSELMVMAGMTKPADACLIEWAATCSKPRPDGFGGGCALVWPGEVEWIAPWQIANEKIEAARKEADDA